MTTHHCIAHGPEIREPRFAELDALIAAGWGSVPYTRIEEERQKHGGTLPPRPFSQQEELDFPEWLEAARAANTPVREIVYAALCAGHVTSADVAEAIGIGIMAVAYHMGRLIQEKRVALLDRQRKANRRHERRIYEVVA